MVDVKPISTPFVVGDHLSRDSISFPNPTLFRSLVGALQYLTITRHVLAFSVNSICQFMHAPIDDHLLSNAFCVMLKGPFIMVYNFIMIPLMPCLLT